MLKPCIFILNRSSHFQQTLNNFVNCECFFTKLSVILWKANYYNRWACLAQFYMVRSKLEGMAIYVLKQACGHNVIAWVYQQKTWSWGFMRILYLFSHFCKWKQNWRRIKISCIFFQNSFISTKKCTLLTIWWINNFYQYNTKWNVQKDLCNFFFKSLWFF